MNYLPKEKVVGLINLGHAVNQVVTPDLGTTSLFRPIKRTGRHITRYMVNDEGSFPRPVNHSVGKALIKNMKKIKSYRSGISQITEYRKNKPADI